MTSLDFLSRFGLYVGLHTWWRYWLSDCVTMRERQHSLEENEMLILAAHAYSGRVRHPLARRQLIETIASAGHVSVEVLEGHMLSLAPPSPVAADCPVALTPRLLQAMSLVQCGLTRREPVLVVGSVGCGKTTLARALAELRQSNLQWAYLAAETESSFLVGQSCPSERGGAAISWQDGKVTTAVKEGHWVLLDNLASCDPCVLERLNPLLEQDVCWVLTEKGETQPTPVSPHFRVLATMGLAGAGQRERHNELSPALSNRFTSVVLDDCPDIEGPFVDELRAVAAAVMGLEDDEAQGVAGGCWLLWTHLKGGQGVAEGLLSPITFRTLVRMLDSAYRLGRQYPRADVGSLLLAAFQFTMAGQFESTHKAEVTPHRSRDLQNSMPS